MQFEVHVVATEFGAKYYRPQHHTSQFFFLIAAHKKDSNETATKGSLPR